MKVILKENIKSLGKMGDIKDVRNGFANNYLFPNNLALMATDANMKVFEDFKRTASKRAEKNALQMKDLVEKLAATSVNITVQAGADDKLYGSVTTGDIADALAKQGIEIDKRKIMLDEPIKQIGLFPVKVHLAQDVEAEVKVWVIKQ